jgi:glycerol dehydrogenase-like iron-containing ADH family enzyme
MIDLKQKINVVINKNLTHKIEENIAKMGLDYAQILFVSDENIWQNNKQFFRDDFAKKFVNFLILKNPQANENFVNKIIQNAKNCNLIIAFGSGTINDLCKYSAKKLNKNYIILVSALSMNGYVSKNASIAINNHKKTLEAKLPIAVWCDLKILKNAPEALNKAGLADVLCFYSCNFDLALNHFVFLQSINFQALKIQQKIIKNFAKNYKNFKLKDDKFLRILLKMILTSGWAMTIADSSAPASQSEHLLAHVLTMKYPEKTHDILHGRLIASSTILSLNNQEKIIEYCHEKLFIKFLENFFEDLRENDFFNEINQYFGTDLALECSKEYKIKKDYLLKNSEKIINNFKKNKTKITKILQKNYCEKDFLIKIFNHFKIDFDFNNIGFEDNEINDAQHFAKYIRNRLTISDFS